jgi:oligoribonuclease
MPAPSETPPQRRQSPTNLVWLDLEMTGLDAQTDAILQAAVIITDAELTPLEELAMDIWQPETELAKMTPFVRDMHEKTGLVERVRRSKTELRRAEEKLLEVVSGWCPYGAVLCGNSIWQDRRFIDRYMPGLSKYLHYRLVDVSAIKVLAKTWYGPTALYTKPGEGEHDALVDVHNSIKELAHYRKTLFR